MAVRCLENFMADSAVWGGPPQYQFYKKGDTIRDPTLSAHLKRTGCPVADVSDQSIAMCPLCGEICSHERHKATVVYAELDCALPYQDQLLELRAGESIQVPWLVDAAVAAKLPVEETDGVKCPRCGHLFC